MSATPQDKEPVISSSRASDVETEIFGPGTSSAVLLHPFRVLVFVLVCREIRPLAGSGLQKPAEASGQVAARTEPTGRSDTDAFVHKPAAETQCQKTHSFAFLAWIWDEMDV